MEFPTTNKDLCNWVNILCRKHYTQNAGRGYFWKNKCKYVASDLDGGGLSLEISIVNVQGNKIDRFIIDRELVRGKDWETVKNKLNKLVGPKVVSLLQIYYGAIK